MSKTNDPHVGSFLAFACWADERIRGAYEGLPEWLPLPPTSGGEEPEFATALRHAAEHNEIRKRLLVKDEEQRLLEAGVPAAELCSEAMQSYVAINVQIRALLNQYRDNDRIQRPKTRPADSGWRPDRATIVRVIAGTHFAFGNGNRASTAKLLNRGISRTDKICGVTGSEVRNVVRPLLSKRVHNLQRLEIEAMHLGWNAYALNEIWLAVTTRSEYRGRPMPRIAYRIAASGELLDLYEMAINKAATALDTGPMIVGLLGQQIKLLEHELKRRAA
jgi:hypothetical protein